MSGGPYNRIGFYTKKVPKVWAPQQHAAPIVNRTTKTDLQNRVGLSNRMEPPTGPSQAFGGPYAMKFMMRPLSNI